MKKMYKNARSIWTWIVWQVKVAKSEKVEALFMLKDLVFFLFYENQCFSRHGGEKNLELCLRLKNTTASKIWDQHLLHMPPWQSQGNEKENKQSYQYIYMYIKVKLNDTKLSTTNKTVKKQRKLNFGENFGERSRRKCTLTWNRNLN